MIAYTVTRRDGDIETSVRVEVPETMTLHERAEELAMATDEVFGPGEEESAPVPSPVVSESVQNDERARLVQAARDAIAPMRARIASDHAVFNEIASLLESTTGGDNVHAAGALAKRAASQVVPK